MFLAPSQNQLKRFQRLRRQVIETIKTYALFEPNDVIVCVPENTVESWFLVSVINELKATIWPELVVLTSTCEQQDSNAIYAVPTYKEQVIAHFWHNLTEVGQLAAVPVVTHANAVKTVCPLYFVSIREMANLASACNAAVPEPSATPEVFANHPNISMDVVLKSLSQVVPSHLLDRQIFDFNLND